MEVLNYLFGMFSLVFTGAGIVILILGAIISVYPLVVFGVFYLTTGLVLATLFCLTDSMES